MEIGPDTNDVVVPMVKMGGLRKIADAPQPCFHPEHNPPTHIVLEPGLYEYTCPNCGRTSTFTVP